MPQSVNRMSFTLGPNFLKTRGGNTKPARSLIELTGDKNIFKILHVAFVWTLKACGSRISETLLEGPPTEDSIIDMENQEGMLKDSARPEYWVPDEQIKTCVICEEGFSLKRPIHHCRACGQGVCTECSQGRRPVPLRGWDYPVRVCSKCEKKKEEI